MVLFGLFGSKKGNQGEDDFMAKMKAMAEEAREREGTSEQELPNGQGEFGLSPDNPIPFSSIAASR